MSEALSVFLNRAPLGIITLEGKEDRYALEYAQSWLDGAGYPISPHLKPSECESERIKRFLANLLPEGKWLEELSVGNQISKSNIFGLVALIGTETTGALTFQYAAAAQKPWPTQFREVSAEELTERIAHRQQVSIAQWDGKPRLSLAGMQDKLPIMIRPNGVMGFGEGNLASTHILKFGRRPDMHMIINEFICMKLAQLIKLPVAKVSLVRFGEPVLAVERFDRWWNAERVERLHLIDGCQILDLPPTYKYERPFGKSGSGAKIRTGATLPKLFEACQLCRVPARALRDLVNWTLFQLIIGNSDAHAKNISYFMTKAGIDVAPGYDLMNIDIYGDDFERDLAMSIGDEFMAEKVMPYDLALFCEACNLPQRQVAISINNLCKAVLGNLDRLPTQDVQDGDEMCFVQNLISRIRSRAERLQEMAKELPQVKL